MAGVRNSRQIPRLRHHFELVLLAPAHISKFNAPVSFNVETARHRMGARLRYLRTSVRGYSAQKLSELLFIHFSYRIDSTTLTKIETGDSRPNIDLLFCLCQLYEVDMNTLLDFEVIDTAQSPRRLLTDPDLTGELQQLIELGGRQSATLTLMNITRALNELLEDGKHGRTNSRRFKRSNR